MNQSIILGQDFGGQTVIHPVALIITLITGLLMLIVPRRSVVIPLLVAGMFVPIQQRFVIATLDFFMLRILVLLGWSRILMRAEYHQYRMCKIDKVVILWAVSLVVTYTFLWQTAGAFFNRLGMAFDALGLYFLFRMIVRDAEDIQRVVKTLAIIVIPLAIFMLVERATGRNMFYVFGGVPEMTFVRDGRLRCQGAFMHPILAGSFGAAMVPLFVALWKTNRQARSLAVVGLVSATLVTINSASSGPMLAYLAGVLGFFFWPLRREMPFVKWLIVVALLFIQLFMKAPIWALFMRVQVLGASGGYHRFFLIDEFIKHFSEWWLLGTKYTSHWGYYLFDVTNHYIRVAVDGGLITLVFFVAIITSCFKSVGTVIKRPHTAPELRTISWGIGASLFTHVLSFVSVSYFDQIIVIWYLTLAIIATVTNIAVGESSSLAGGNHEKIFEGRRLGDLNNCSPAY